MNKKVVYLIAALWLVALIAVIELKLKVAMALLPIIGIAFLFYAIYCSVSAVKSDSSKVEEKTDK